MNILNSDSKRQVRVSQANWLNLLSGIENKDVLKVGVKKTDNIISISYSNPKTLSCIGDLDDCMGSIVDVVYKNIDAVPVGIADFVILDETDFFVACKSYEKIKIILLKIAKTLKDNGVLMLCFPDGILNFKYRYLINRALAETEFISKAYYFCEPSSEEPMCIVSYSTDSLWMTGGFPNFNEKPFIIKERIKKYIKQSIFDVMKLYYPFRGIVVVAKKNIDTQSYLIPSFDKLKNINSNNEVTIEYQGKPLRYVCYTGRYLKKHYLFFYNLYDDEIVLIGKIGYSSDLPIDDIEREYKNLILMTECYEMFSKKNINIATLVHYDHSIEKSILIQSSVPGKSLRYLLSRYEYHNNKAQMLKLIDQISDAQLYIQDTCTNKLGHAVAKIDEDYFYNYTDMDLDGDLFWKLNILNFIQHGDFTANNIFYEEASEQWGIIDWEWQSIGFPPLFDLFSLFASVRFASTNIKKYSEYEGYYISLVDTFFDKNWFSDHLVILIIRYCDHYHLKYEIVYTCFIAFILFHCNKFRKNKLPDYQYLYEKFLKYAEDNKDRFILNQALENN